MDAIIGMNNSLMVCNGCFVIPMLRQLALFKNVFYSLIYHEVRHVNARTNDIRQFGSLLQIKSQVWLKIWEFVIHQTPT